MQTIEVPKLGKFFFLGKVNIDGDLFLLTLPTYSQWHALMCHRIDDMDFGKDWFAFWDSSSGERRLFCQDYPKGPMSDPVLVKLHGIEEPEFMDACDITANPTQKYISMVFVPALIPVNKDMTYAGIDRSSDLMKSFGGSCFINNKLKSLDGNIDDASVRFVDVKKFLIGDTADGFMAQTVLPWIQVEHGYVCPMGLINCSSFLKLCELLNRSL